MKLPKFLLTFIKLRGLELSGKAIRWVEVFRVGIILHGNFLDGNCPGGNFPGGIYPGCELSKWELSGGNHPGWEFF